MTSNGNLDDWNQEERSKYIVHDVFLVLYFLAGVVGNIIVIIIYLTKLKKSSESRYFFPFLAFFDLCACGLRVPFELWKALLPVQFQNLLGCQIFWWLVNFFSFSSIYLLAFISFQRYLKVCRPFGFQLTLTVRRCCLVVVVLMGVAFASPFIIWNDIVEVPNSERNVTAYICRADFSKYGDTHSFHVFVMFFSLFFIVVMIALVVFNILILKQMHDTLKNKTNKRPVTIKFKLSKKSSDTSLDSGYQSDHIYCVSMMCEGITYSDQIPQRKRKELRTNYTKSPQTRSVMRFSYMIIIINFALVLSCIPQVILLFAYSRNRYFWVENTDTELIVFRFMEHIAITNNIVNPYVYGYFDNKFRHAAKELFWDCCCAGMNVE